MAKSWAPEGLSIEDTGCSGVHGDVGIHVGPTCNMRMQRGACA